MEERWPYQSGESFAQIVGEYCDPPRSLLAHVLSEKSVSQVGFKNIGYGTLFRSRHFPTYHVFDVTVRALPDEILHQSVLSLLNSQVKRGATTLCRPGRNCVKGENKLRRARNNSPLLEN